jgi:hypothetical protein
MREQRVVNIEDLHKKKSKEIRIKTARVKKMRDRMSTATKASRENLLLRRISSAKEIRTQSRLLSPRQSGLKLIN